MKRSRIHKICQIKPRSRWVACLLFVIYSFISIGMRGTTGIVEGRAVDKQTQERLIGVNVVLIGTGLGAVTDTAGEYRVGNVRAGVYDVRFSLIGYKPVIMKKVTILPDLRTRLDVELEQSAIEVEAVEIRAEKPLIQTDQAATAFSVGEVKLEKLPIGRFQEVLLLQPGTTLEGNVRGGKTNEVVYLVDGLPIQDVIGGGLGSNIPKSSITSLSIHTGGFEAEYGNAMSGVVNLITKSGNDRQEFSVRYERDSWLPEGWNRQQNRAAELELTASGSVVPGEVYFFTANSISTSDTRWWEDFRHFFLSPISHEVSGFAKLDYVFSPTTRLTTQGIYSVSSWRDYEYSWRFNLTGLPTRSRNSYRIGTTLSSTLSDNTFFTMTASAFQLNTRIGDTKDALTLQPYEYDFFLRYIIGGTRNWWANTRQTIYTVKGDLTSEIFRNHIFKVGAELNQYHILSDLVKYEPQTTYFGKPIAGAPLLNYSNTYAYRPRSGSVYIQDKVELVRDGSNFSIGLRWDFLDPTAERPVIDSIPTNPNEFDLVSTKTTKTTLKQQLSGRISFAAPVGPRSFFFANVGQYFQYPLFDYLYSGINPVQLRQGVKNVLAGNPDLEPERSIAWEMGFKHGVNENVVFSATYFRKKFTKQIDTKTLVPFDSKFAGDYGFASYVNNAEASATGLEFVLSRERDERVAGSISYSYMTTEGISESVNQTINYSQWGFPLPPVAFPLSWDQRHTVKADADFRLVGDIQVNMILLYNSARPYTYFPTRDGYKPLDTMHVFVPNNARMFDVTLLNIKLSKDFRFGELHATVFNVYAHVSNLLNKKNVRWVDSNGRIGGELEDPNAYYEPRRIRIGVKLTF